MIRICIFSIHFSAPLIPPPIRISYTQNCFKTKHIVITFTKPQNESKKSEKIKSVLNL